MTWQPPPVFSSEKEEPQMPRTPPSIGGGERVNKTKALTTPPTHVPDLPGESSRMHRLTTVPTVAAEQTPWIMPPQRQLSPTTRTTSPPAGHAPTSSNRRSTRKDGGGWNQALFVPDPQTGTPKDGASRVQQQEQDGTVPLDHGSDCDSDEDVIRVPSREYLDGTNNKSIASKRENPLLVDQTLRRTRIQWSQLLVSKAFKRYRQMICAMDDDLPNPGDIDDIDAMTAEDVLETNTELIKVRDEMLDDPHLNEKEIAAFFEGYNLFQMKVNSLQSQLNSWKTLQRHQSYCTNNGEMVSAPQRRVLSDLPGGLTPENSGKSAALSRVSFGTQPIPPVRTHHDDDDLGSEQPMVSTLESRSTPPKGGFHTRSSPSLRLMSIQRIRKETSGRKGSEDVQKLLEELEIAERRQKKLERQLAQAGVVIADDIPYDVAKQKVASIAQRMDEIGFANTKDKKLQEEYFLLEREMEKYTGALQLTDDWIEEQEQLERQWEESVAQGNERAAKNIRRHMPVDVRNRSEASLATDVTPNGKVLPKEIAKKFKRTNVLQLLRIDPRDIAPMHAATLENLRDAGVTLTERRALYHHLKDIGSRWKAMQGDTMTERKWTWFSMMKSNFKDNLKEWQNHVEQYGPPDNHRYLDRSHPEAGGCPLLGRQCPVKADNAINYDGDYGFPEGPEYFRADVKNQSDVGHLSKEKHEAQDVLKEKKARERSTALRSHYKGKILSVTMANGSCESMDDIIDAMESAQENWIKKRLSEGYPSEEAKKKELGRFKDALKELKLSVLQLAERSGMQLTGKRDANADQLDSRSIVELALCEDVMEAAFDFLDGIEERMLEVRLKDGTVTVTIQQLRTLLDELHERNVSTMTTLGQVRPPRSSVLKTRQVILMNLNLQNNLGREGKAIPTPDGEALPGLPVRGGDLRAALAGRGVSGPGRGGSPGRGRGPGGLLAAIGRHGKQES